MAKKAWLVTVSMGYGHQRTTYPLKGLAAQGKIISANDYPGIPKGDKRIWQGSKSFYETISRFKRFPLIGEAVFGFYDRLQEIISFYPKKDLSKANLQLQEIFSLIERGWGKHLIEKLSSKRPFVTSFFTPAFMAEVFNYPGEIFCIVCDADVARTWAPLIPHLSKIKYLVPNQRVLERLELYGVKTENIFLTGYPLPKENIGTEKMEVLKKDIAYRLVNLDREKKYAEHYALLIKKYLGILPKKPDHPLTIMFAVGGAGAQKEIGIQIVKSLKSRIEKKEMKVILVAGTRQKVKRYFQDNIQALGLLKNKNVEIIFEKDIETYFQKFNQALRKTDILYTKPSELSFYSALGIPIIVAPCIGSQEEFNKRWLLKSSFGVSQNNPAHINEWLLDWLKEGYLAEVAMESFIEGEKLGTFKIEKIVLK